MSNMRRIGVFSILSCACFAGSAVASPWTLPDGQMVLGLATDVQVASNEFLVDGTRQAFPLNGQFFSMNLRPSLRFGLSDATELGVLTSIVYITYQSDEVYFEPAPSPELTLSQIRNGILTFDRQAAGLGDVFVYLRQRLNDPGRVAIAFEVNVKLPTGYRPLTDAFDETEDAIEGGLVDDVTIGDGQLDLTGLFLLGVAPPGGWFFRLDAGMRARFFGPGQQVLGGLKIGATVMPEWIPYAYADGFHTFTEGDIVGQVPNALDPSQDAESFNSNNIVLNDLRLDRTMVRVGGGSIFRIGDREIDINYSYVVWGQNISQVHFISLGTNFVL